MNILPALTHHLNQHHPHQWAYTENKEGVAEPFTRTQITGTQNTITIIIWQEDNTILIRSTTQDHNIQETLDLLNPHFLDQLQQTLQPEKILKHMDHTEYPPKHYYYPK